MYRNNNNGNRNFDHYNSRPSNSYSQSDNRRRNYGDQRYNDNQSYNGGRSNRSNNYPNPRLNDNLSERRPCRGGPHQSLRPGRSFYYDPYDSRSRQSSVRPHSRVRHTSQEEQISYSPVSHVPDETGWGGDRQGRRELGESTRDNRDLTSVDLSPSITTCRTNPPVENDNADDDESVDWHYSDITNSVINRPLSPLFDFVEKENDRFRSKVSQNRSQSRSQSQSQNQNQNQRNNEAPEDNNEDNNEDYKGVSFPPPFPMVPVSSTADLPTRPKTSPRIFENDSRSSALEFDRLKQLSTMKWKSCEDVPLEYATKELHDLELNINENQLSNVSIENDKIHVSPENPNEQNLPVPSESHNSSRKNQNQKSKDYGDYGFFYRSIFKTQKQTERIIITNNSIVEKTTSVITEESEAMCVEFKHAQVCNLVNNIIRNNNNTDWLTRILDKADTIVPNIALFDTETMRNFLQMIYLKIHDNKNNKDVKDAKRLINMVIKEPSSFKKIFSYMKNEIRFGSDLLIIIRITNFIVKLSPDAARQIPRDDINNVFRRVENTLSETDSNNARELLGSITEYRSKALRDADDKKKLDYQMRVADQSGVTFQAKVPLKPLNEPKPDWIASHRHKYVKKPLMPSPEEIFDLEAMLTMPTLTSHLVDQSWLPEYEDIYRQVHFDLFRTEVVEDLQRSSVAFLASYCQEYSPKNSPFYNYVFYRDVRIESTNINNDFTPYVKVGFKTSKSVDWIKGEHLIYGTFVLLFKAKIEFGNVSIDKSSMVCAMVEHFKLDDVIGPNSDKGQEKFVGLTFSESEFDKLDLNGKYVMLESTRNYASIKPVMEWLETKNIQKNFPLFHELFTCCTDNSLPVYLENVAIDITSILVEQRRPIVTSDRMKWPPYKNPNDGSPAYNMELSSVIALRQIISRKVAVIMAPVVTSKAKVASKAVEFLNRALRQSQCFEPIIILTSSSYALDSILEKLLPFFPDLVRCGSLSKCNPVLESRQIQDVASEYLNSRRSTLWREWGNARNNMITIQEELAALWSFRERVLLTQYFIESSPQAFRDQLIPALLKKRNYEPNIITRCFELWLAGVSESYVANNMFHPNINQQRADSTFISNQNFDLKPIQDSPSLFIQLAKSYLFENDWTKTNGCYDDDDDSISFAFEDQINDRFIFKSEENNFIRYNNLNKYSTKFKNDVTKGFWGESGPNIWTMKPDDRRSLYERFHKCHIDYCDQKIHELQKSAISQAERVKSVRMARWAEVCNFAQVVGMTVNFAIANREVLGSLKPRVCIVDEASEIPESTLMFLIASDRLEHLVMFGDLQYSKPDVKSKTAQKHGLDISLFERWVKSDRKDHVSLEQQSHMHPAVRELVRVIYDEDLKLENEAPKRDIPKIKGVPSHVFFMTHDNFDRNARSFSTNTFEAEFIIKFAFYLYQQGYDPAKITILTPYFAQKRLILGLLEPELKKERTENMYGRFDKERNKTGMIKVELIDNYHSDENEVVLLSLVTVSEKWHEEALKTLNNKKRAIIALSRAIHALYIFGNEKLLRKSEIWAPVVEKLTRNHVYGESLILSCNTHVKPRIEIKTLRDFTTKVPYGGCSEPCRGLLKCGHACQRKCHPIHHSNEVEYVCRRSCGGQNRPEECDHDCPKLCYECERSGKCPPCDQIVNIKLRCGHSKSIPCHRRRSNVVCEENVEFELRCRHIRNIKCYQKDNDEFLMTMECKEISQFRFPNCNHKARLPCSTRYPVCKETCGEALPCGHRCQRQCGVKHSHERSDCLYECPKTLICGHKCANGCSDPDRHTSFCTKQCRIKCLHGSVCPKHCYETCTKCLEPCPWECPHYKCRKKCNEPCSRPPCQKRCNRTLKCNHKCNGYCGEECPPCLRCNPNLQCKITLQSFYELNPNEFLYILPECRCVFSADGLDLYFENQVKNGEHTAVKLWQCPGCQEPIFTAMRYNRYLKTEINLWNIIKRKQESARNRISLEERRQIIKAMNEETRTIDLNSMVGGRWFVCPNNHPYYIGNCGGATQVSKCPDCYETIGGVQHKVVSTNRFYGEFDNSSLPAWPGQH